MESTLVILAAGMASRYGSMKQVEGFGPHGETIIDYSIYDAIQAGFSSVIFIIREEFAEAFKANFEPKLHGKIKTDYVYQDLNKHLGEHTLPSDRTKPWGTGHAILCCKELINGPFAVINADDYYGKEGFALAADFLKHKCSNQLYALIGYRLANTLSDNGSVSRGVCEIDTDGNLNGITERTKIYKKDHAIVFEENGEQTVLAPETIVGMNFYCFGKNFVEIAEEMFAEFLATQLTVPKSEFYIPKVADQFIRTGLGKMEVIPTESKWFGVTYKEDAEGVRKNITDLIANGAYPENLWNV